MNQLKLYDTRTQKTDLFSPFTKKNVTMYVCGITPDGPAHIGHAFTFTIYDMFVRYLRHIGYTVDHVQNVTDIDDPLVERAKKEHSTEKQTAKKWTDYLKNESWFLNNKIPDHYINASEEIAQMQKIIAGLLEKGFAYQSGGTIYYEVKKFPHYGELSKCSREEMLKMSEERGGDIHDKNKRDPLDFVLWRTAKKGEPSFDSPWGKGRPGWHIECTAINTKYLGEQIVIHGGGADLTYPHHDSEIAQAEGFSGKYPFVKYWMHCAMVYQDGEKMSKSLGNLTFVKDLTKKYSANQIRFYLLSHYYRSEWEYNESDLAKNAKKMAEIEDVVKNVGIITNEVVSDEFLSFLAEDFNTPKALELLHKEKNPKKAKAMFNLLGFNEKTAQY